MSDDRLYIGRQARTLNAAPQFDGYSKVIIIVSDELEYHAGTDTGRTLEVPCAWGTQQMANDILQKVTGFAYQPYSAEGAIIDPAAELGDAVTVKSTYGGIYSLSTKFSRLLTADISAPYEEEIDHEYPYISQTERKVTRQFADVGAQLVVQHDMISAEVQNRISDIASVRAALTVEANRITAEVKAREDAVTQLNASLTVQAGEIAAKVSKTGGSSSTFGWTLTDSSWEIKANSTTILKATKNGLEVNGKIVATSGKIGGFDIMSNYLSYNGQTWNGTNSTGIYVGISGIQLGKNFKVDSMGNLTAYSGTFTGYVRAGSIQYGGDNGTFSGSGITTSSISGNRLQSGTVTTSYTSSGINTSLGYADFANNVFNGRSTASNILANSVNATRASVSSYFYVGGDQARWYSKTFTDGDGNSVTIRYLGSA